MLKNELIGSIFDNNCALRELIDGTENKIERNLCEFIFDIFQMSFIDLR